MKRRLEGTDPWIRLDASEHGTTFGRGLDHFDTNRGGTNPRGQAPFLVRGPSTVYEPTSALPIGEWLDSHRAALARPESYNPDWPLSPREVVGPAVMIHTVGKGTVLTFAGSPDFATASEHHLVEARKLFANAVRLLHPDPRVRITAPANVEAVVMDDPEARILRIHLVAYNATPQTTPAKDRPYVLPGLIEDAPLYRASIEFRDRVGRVQALNRTTEIRKRGQRMGLTIADIHEVIQCRY